MNALKEAAECLEKCSKDQSEAEFIAHQTCAKNILASIDRDLEYDDLPWDIGVWLVPLVPFTNPLDDIPLLASIVEKGNAKELLLIFSEQLNDAIAAEDLLLSCQFGCLTAKILNRIKTANLSKFAVPIITSMVDSLHLIDAEFFRRLYSNYSDEFDDKAKANLDEDRSLYESHLTIISIVVNLCQNDDVDILEILKYWLMKLVTSLISAIPLELYGAWAEKNKRRLLAQRRTSYRRHLTDYPAIMHQEELLRLCRLLNIAAPDITKVSTKQELSMWTVFKWSEVASFQAFISAIQIQEALPALISILSSNIQNAGIVDLIIYIVRMHSDNFLTDGRFQFDIAPDMFRLLQSIGTFSATNESPSMRAFSNDLYATIITSLDGSLSLHFIKDVLERCPFDNLRAATIDVLKTCFAQGMTKEGSVYSTLFALKELSSDLYGIRFRNLQEFSNSAMSIQQTLNLIYFLMATDKHDKTGIKRDQAIRERNFIGPLRRAVDGWINDEEEDTQLVNELVKTRLLLDMLDVG